MTPADDQRSAPGGQPLGVRLRPLTLGEILDQAIQLYRANFLLFFGVVAVVYIPAYLAVAYFYSEGFLELMRTMQPLSEGEIPAEELGELLQIFLDSYLLIVLPALVFEMLVKPVAAGALTVAASRRVFGHALTIGEAYRSLRGIFWGFYGAVLLVGLVRAVGLVFCIAPGVIFSIMFALTAEVAVIERLGGGRALGRAYDLARNEWGKIFLLGLVLLVLVVVASFGARSLVELLFDLDLDDPEQLTFPAFFWSTFVAQLVEVLVVPFQLCAWLLLFYDIKVRREGYDIEVMAHALEQALPPTERDPGAPEAPPPAGPESSP